MDVPAREGPVATGPRSIAWAAVIGIALLEAAIRLGWTAYGACQPRLLAHYRHTLLIPGTANPAHVAENVAAGDIWLDDEALAALDRIGAPGVR